MILYGIFIWEILQHERSWALLTILFEMAKHCLSRWNTSFSVTWAVYAAQEATPLLPHTSIPLLHPWCQASLTSGLPRSFYLLVRPSNVPVGWDFCNGNIIVSVVLFKLVFEVLFQLCDRQAYCKVKLRSRCHSPMCHVAVSKLFPSSPFHVRGVGTLAICVHVMGWCLTNDFYCSIVCEILAYIFLCM